MNIQRLPESYENEAALRVVVERVLDGHFRIEREVWGTHCSGKRLRIDAVVTPSDGAGWKSRPVFGVEFKMPRESFDTRDFTSWAAQAINYTHVRWDGWGHVPILTCPSVLPRLACYGDGAVALTSRILGQLGVGELVRIRQEGWAILMNEHVVWSERAGVRAGARWNLRTPAQRLAP